MITFETIKSVCPLCGYKVDQATFAFSVGKEKKAPEAGDISICFNCAAVNIFSDGFGTIRRPSYDELRKIATDKKIQRTVRLLMELHAERLINEINRQ